MRAVFIALLTIPLAGCFQSSTVLHVNADGSGTIEQRTLVTEAAMDQLRTFAILGGGNPDAADPTSEAQAKALAGVIGTGVTYVSSMPVAIDKYKGRDTIYAFTDVTKIRLSEQPNLPGIPIPPQAGVNTPPIQFALDHTPDGDVVLRLLVPRPALFPAGPDGRPMPPSADQITMVRQLLAGARLSVVVAPEGTLVRTNSPFVDANRVTLLDVDIDQASADPDLVKKIQSAASPDQTKAAVASIPGLKVTLEPEISIEFRPAP